MSDKTKFLIVCNMKSGSTWLELMLGSLRDVAVDYEFKWRPEYAPSPEHMVIPDRNFRCGQALSTIQSDKPILGSKLVFDIYDTTEVEYEGLTDTIESDIRVIHLTRNYIELYLSATYHPGIKLNECAKHDSQSVLLRSMLEKNPNVDRINLETKLSGQVFVVPESFAPVLHVMLMNDLAAMRLSQRKHYMVVDYTQVREKFADIASFVGSRATQAEFDAILANPPTVKNPKMAPHQLIQNYDQLVDLANMYEEQKKQFLARLLELRKIHRLDPVTPSGP
ncbi:MAG: hypothetical protein HQL57_01715 [Magnetococcales bacterium]|nr:hypothetical protein [Magnetococcales bacterium]